MSNNVTSHVFISSNTQLNKIWEVFFPTPFEVTLIYVMLSFYTSKFTSQFLIDHSIFLLLSESQISQNNHPLLSGVGIEISLILLSSLHFYLTSPTWNYEPKMRIQEIPFFTPSLNKTDSI